MRQDKSLDTIAAAATPAVPSAIAILRISGAQAFSVLRAGGDTRSAVMLDSGYMWAVIVPASLLCAFLLPATGHADVRIAFVIVQVLMNLKVFWGLAIINRGQWARNMTIGA